MNRSAPPPGTGHEPDSHPQAVPPVLYRAMLDSLDQPDRTDVIDAVTRHDEEVRAADAAGIQATEAR